MTQNYHKKLSTNFLNTITHRLGIILINLDDDDNPSDIYQSLNYKSEKLSDSDLIRNFIFMEVGDLENQEEFNEVHWSSFEDQFEEYSEENSKSKVQEDFYYRYLISKTEYFPHRSLYKKFILYVSNRFQDKKKGINNLVNELKEYAENYISINYFCEETELEICFKRFRLLGVSTAAPLLLHFYDIYKKDEKFPFERFYRVLRMTESFIIRRTIVGARTRGYGEDFAEAIEKSKTIEI